MLGLKACATTPDLLISFSTLFEVRLDEEEMGLRWVWLEYEFQGVSLCHSFSQQDEKGVVSLSWEEPVDCYLFKEASVL